MAYISGGSVVNRRTRMRPSILTDMFWSVVNLIVAFFQTMIDPEFADNYGGKKRDRPVAGMGGGGGGGGGMGGGGGGGRGSNVHGTGRIRGIDHSAPMAGG